jgi:hypothetical protein
MPSHHIHLACQLLCEVKLKAFSKPAKKQTHQRDPWGLKSLRAEVPMDQQVGKEPFGLISMA